MKPGTENAGGKQGDAAAPAAEAPKAAAVRKPKVDDKVHVVHATRKEHMTDGEITRVNKDGTVDLVCTNPSGGKKLEITGSPCDPTGVLSDSWHFPEVE